MKVFDRKNKGDKDSGNFYFGDYGEIPIGFSAATITEDSKKDTRHYHKKGYEFYFTISGSGVIDIEGEEFVMDPSKLVMVEPMEKHFVKKAVDDPFSFIAICTTKDKDDKVVSD